MENLYAKERSKNYVFLFLSNGEAQHQSGLHIGGILKSLWEKVEDTSWEQTAFVDTKRNFTLICQTLTCSFLPQSMI